MSKMAFTMSQQAAARTSPKRALVKIPFAFVLALAASSPAVTIRNLRKQTLDGDRYGHVEKKEFDYIIYELHESIEITLSLGVAEPSFTSVVLLQGINPFKGSCDSRKTGKRRIKKIKQK